MEASSPRTNSGDNGGTKSPHYGHFGGSVAATDRIELETANSSLSHASSLSKASLPTRNDGLRKPKRLVDFFCVLGAKQELTPRQLKRDLSKTNGPAELSLQTRLIDCYPKSRPDMEFPNLIHTFCFPNGCCVSKELKSPTLLTQVLTSGSGHRLYSAVLTFYDTTTRASQFLNLLSDFEYKGNLPSWLVDENDERILSDPKERMSEQAVSKKNDEEYYLPKCLVVVSHYAFFDVFRKFLQQLYRIYTCGASPLPLERFIANFVNDVPLPPEGRAKVQWECFTRGFIIEIFRPPPNQLPLVNFSFHPLFNTLSVANILVVWGCLLKEGRVALCSKYHSLLTPVAEALLCLLFPLEWQGIYIPVLPSSMLDVLDAPLPFFVGLDSMYLKNSMDHRPANVVFVDLDEDIVHLGWHDYGTQWKPNRIPDLPDRAIMELKVRLEELGDHLYLVPTCGIKARMTSGDDDTLLDNANREPFAQMTRLHNGRNREDTCHRSFILCNAERAFVDEENCPLLEPADFLLSGKEAVTRQRSYNSPMSTKRNPNVIVSLKRKTRTVQAHTDRLLAFVGQQYATPNPFNTGASDRALKKKRFHLATQLYELDTSDDREFSTFAVRHAFLDFFVDIFVRYSKYTRTGAAGADILFRREAFIKDLPLSFRNKEYISTLVHTQMFERFLHDGSRRKTLFDEHILVKLNRDSLFGSVKRPTPFLDNPRWKVRKTIKPLSPYVSFNWSKKTYAYEEFPALKEEEFLSHEDDAATSWSDYCSSNALCSALLCWPST